MKRNYSLIHKITAFFMVLAISAPVFAFGGNGSTDKKGKALTEDQKILHVLNRLGFGARPGDVERVKAMGLQKYIEQQLNPAAINDSVAESKVKNLEIFQYDDRRGFRQISESGRAAPPARRRQTQSGKQSERRIIRTLTSKTTEKDRQERQAKLREYYQRIRSAPGQSAAAADHGQPRAARRLFGKTTAGSDGRFLAESF